ncbi:MAG: tyrosine-type recombinase/integrase [Candidatus Acetothermia bacterium]|nr:tyrosine-type recombinase/integrase [Candidatus Bipolaricaulota bacterium]
MTEEQIKRLKKTLRGAARAGQENGKYIPVRDWCILHIALDAGLRVSEICDLKIRDLLIDQGGSSIIVRSGKGDKKRGVSIGGNLRNHIKRYIEWKDEHCYPVGKEDPLFLSPSGKNKKLTRQAIYHIFKRWAKRAGLPDRFSIHSCRHTYASMLYKSSNYNLRLVQSQLGHSSIQTTQVYADVLNKDAEKAVNDLPQ